MRHAGGLRLDPDGGVCWLYCAVDRVEQVGTDGVDLNGISQAVRERRYGGLGVIAGAVETAIDEPLRALAQWVEERRGG